MIHVSAPRCGTIQVLHFCGTTVGQRGFLDSFTAICDPKFAIRPRLTPSDQCKTPQNDIPTTYNWFPTYIHLVSLLHHQFRPVLPVFSEFHGLLLLQYITPNQHMHTTNYAQTILLSLSSSTYSTWQNSKRLQNINITIQKVVIMQCQSKYGPFIHINSQGKTAHLLS